MEYTDFWEFLGRDNWVHLQEAYCELLKDIQVTLSLSTYPHLSPAIFIYAPRPPGIFICIQPSSSLSIHLYLHSQDIQVSLLLSSYLHLRQTIFPYTQGHSGT